MSSNIKLKKKKCGLIMPISAIDTCSTSHWEAVFSIIKEALSETEFIVELVSDSDEIGVIQKRIVHNIYDNEIVVCDISAKNPNVMFELGMRLAFDKPAIIIKDDKTNYSFDTASIEHLGYPRDLNYPDIQEFKIRLKDKVIATFEASRRPEYTTFLKHFGHFVVADIEEKKVGKDDFLLEVLYQIRKDVQILGRRLSTSSAPTYGVEVGPTRGDQVMDFVKFFVGDKVDAATLDELQDSESVLFKSMYKKFLKSTYPASYVGDIEQLKETLQYAVSKLRYACESNNWTIPPTFL